MVATSVLGNVDFGCVEISLEPVKVFIAVNC